MTKTMRTALMGIGLLVACPGFGQRTVRLYEAESEFTIDMLPILRGADLPGSGLDSYNADPLEYFNTRQPDWRSEGVFTRILRTYHYMYPNSEVTDRELTKMLGNAKLELVPHSRLVTITIQSRSPELAAALANAYAEAIESFTDEENKKRCDRAVAQIHEQVEMQKCVDDELADRLLKFRKENRIDTLLAKQAVLNQSLQTTTADMLEYEKRVAAAREWVNVLQAVRKNPENFGELPTEVPRSTDIAAVYTRQQTVKMELAKLKTMYTSEHQAVVVKESELKAITREFAETVKRALATAQGDLTANENQMKVFRYKSEELDKKIAGIGQMIVQADAGLKQLEQEKKVSSEIYQVLLQKENEQRIIAEQNRDFVRVGRPAWIPTKPVAERDGLYEAKSEFTFDARFPRMGYRTSVDIVEIINTRQSDWRSEGIFKKIILRYRANYPNSQVTEKEMGETLAGSEFKLVPHSRRVKIAVRSKSPELAAALANAYAEAIESFTDEENKIRCDKAVAQIHEQVEKKKVEFEQLAARLLKFRAENKIDALQAEQAILNQNLQTTAADVLEYEKRVTVANEWVKVLQAAQKNPENFGELPTEVPRSADIAAAYTKLQKVKMELAMLRTRYTPEYPVVVAKEGELQAITTEFAETVRRALATAQADLTAKQNLLEEFNRKSEELNKKLAVIGQQIAKVDVGLKQLEQEMKVSSEIYQYLLQKENDQRIAAELNNEIIRVGRPAQIPTKPLGLW